MTKMKPLAALRKFFEDAEPKLEMAELKALSSDERTELGILAAKELGVEVDPPVKKDAKA